MESGVHSNGNRPGVAHSSSPGVPANRVICSALPACNSDVPAAQHQARVLEEALNRTLRLREPLAIFIAESESCGAGEPADIGIVWREPGEPSAHVDLLITGTEGALRRVVSGVPAGEVPARLACLVRTYTVERCRQDTFASWARGLGVGELAERLGFSHAAVRPTAAATAGK